MIRHVIAAGAVGIGATLLATSGTGCAGEAPRGAGSAPPHATSSAPSVAPAQSSPTAPLVPSSATSAAPSATAVVSTSAVPPKRSPLEAFACTTDLDCSWDDPCVPRRCEASRGAPVGACEESAPVPGTCSCVEGGCTLRPKKAPLPVGPCEPGGCQVDRSGGTCVADTLGVPLNFRPRKGLSVGPACECERVGCVFHYVDPIPCKSDRDCWVSEEPRPHPVPRPKALRGRDFKPCDDGETEPSCNAQGYCELGLRFSC